MKSMIPLIALASGLYLIVGEYVLAVLVVVIFVPAFVRERNETLKK